MYARKKANEIKSLFKGFCAIQPGNDPINIDFGRKVNVYGTTIGVHTMHTAFIATALIISIITQVKQCNFLITAARYCYKHR